MNPAERERWWKARARRTRRRINIGWWLAAFLPSLLVVSVAGAAGVLAVRHGGGEIGGVLRGYGGCCVVAGAACLAAVRHRFESVADGLVRLESAHRLRNRLTAAAAGVGKWPAPVDAPCAGIAWAWRRDLWPPLVSAALLAAAAWVPVRPAAAESARSLEEPLAWGDVEEWIDILAEEPVVEKAALHRLREQVGELRAQPMQEWYSHSSLEAGDSLRQQTGEAIRELARSLQSARSALAGLAPYEEALPLSMQEAWKKFLGQSLDGLRGPVLPLDPALFSRLAGIDPGRLRQLTAAELQALIEALKRGELACGTCQGGGTNEVAMVTAQSWCSGGITRGPGAAPLVLSEQETRLGEGALEALQNPNLDRAALGDTLAVGQTEHEIDETRYQGPQAAGAVADAGAGGETVWRNPLPPDEQDLLKRFFR